MSKCDYIVSLRKQCGHRAAVAYLISNYTDNSPILMYRCEEHNYLQACNPNVRVISLEEASIYEMLTA